MLPGSEFWQCARRINFEKFILPSDRNIFNQIVYTPLSEALRLLDERQKNPEFMEKIK
jgi:hypothetical protein